MSKVIPWRKTTEKSNMQIECQDGPKYFESSQVQYIEAEGPTSNYCEGLLFVLKGSEGGIFGGRNEFFCRMSFNKAQQIVRKWGKR